MDTASLFPAARPARPLRALAWVRARLAPLRHLPDRLLHARRRRAAVARLRAEPLPTVVLFLCEGNIYRSPYAARVLARELPPTHRAVVRVASAGLVGPGRPSPTDALQAAARRGIDLAPHRSALVTGVHVHAAGVVVVMDARQRRVMRERFGLAARDVLLLGDLDPEPVRTRAVRDPWHAGEEVLEATYARVDRCVRALADALTADRPVPVGAPAPVPPSRHPTLREARLTRAAGRG